MALDQPAVLPEGFELRLITSDSLDTKAVIGINKKGKIRTLEHWPGDGTVTGASALMDDRIGSDWQPRLITPIDWTNVMFLFKSHIDITKNPVFTNNLLYFLLEEPH
ncbi:MAG: hypothetical protein ACYSTX_02465 [Planctomycetota bacterium]|jgi:hypothetical protein